LSDTLRDYRTMLDRMAQAIERGDGVALEELFAQASDARRRWQAATTAPKPVDR